MSSVLLVAGTGVGVMLGPANLTAPHCTPLPANSSLGLGAPSPELSPLDMRVGATSENDRTMLLSIVVIPFALATDDDEVNRGIGGGEDCLTGELELTFAPPVFELLTLPNVVEEAG